VNYMFRPFIAAIIRLQSWTPTEGVHLKRGAHPPNRTVVKPYTPSIGKGTYTTSTWTYRDSTSTMCTRL